MPATVSDFWRMVWEQYSSVIIMVTNLEEKGRVSHLCVDHVVVTLYSVQLVLESSFCDNILISELGLQASSVRSVTQLAEMVVHEAQYHQCSHLCICLLISVSQFSEFIAYY